MLPAPPLTNDDTAFLNALTANPADEAVWLIYSDWLAENDAPRGDYLRTLLDLLTPTNTLVRIAELRQALHTLGGPLDAKWLDTIATTWAMAPMVAIVNEMMKIGNVPPQEMFDRAMSIPICTLLRGTARRGMWIHIPRTEGEPLRERLPNLESYAKQHEALVFRDALPQFAIGFFGHRIAESGVPIGGLIRQAD